LISGLMLMNYTQTLVEQFNFVILLATLTTLVPYAYATAAEVHLFIAQRQRFSGRHLVRDTVVAALAFAYIVLACFWAWMGIVYHLMFFRAINGAALGFGVLFIVQALLWLIFGVVRPKLSFRLQSNPYAIAGMVLIVFAMLIYPLLGALLGHGYPRSPSFGVAPCPTTIFSFGLLLCTTARVPKSVLIIPAIWSVIGFTAALTLGIREDIGLLVAGVVCVGMLLWRDRAVVQAGKQARYA
jgi:hypothetical protein